MAVSTSTNSRTIPPGHCISEHGIQADSRQSEIGIRIALGARPEQVIGLVMRNGLGLVAIGLGLGLMGAAGAARLIETLLFEVRPLDPLVYGTVAVIFTVVAALACVIPSARAARIDPLRALRAE